jgi:hypothetical protein
MIPILFMIANAFAALVLLLTMIGCISQHQLKLDVSMGLSMAVSFGFIFLVVMISLLHPLFFLFYAAILVAAVLFLFRPAEHGFWFAVCFTLVCGLFWSEMVAWFIFVHMFGPQGEDEPRD